jgi:hypothetical protein
MIMKGRDEELAWRRAWSEYRKQVAVHGKNRRYW